MNGICFHYRGPYMPQQPPICQFFALTVPNFAGPGGEKPVSCMEMLASQAIVIDFVNIV